MSTREKYTNTDFVNQKFGKITVTKYIGRLQKSSSDNHKYWEAKCECGNILYLRANQITKVKGCKKCCRKTHGKTNTRLFNIWQSMKARCYNKNNQNFYNYGGKGINICDEWKNSFINFYNWAINNGYKDSLSIDRINCNGNYEPSNCRWTDNYTQANNKTNNKHYYYKGKAYTIRDLCNITGLNYATIQARLYSGWSIEKILDI